MSVSKFRFVSPGVFINEIDNSQLPRLPADMGPVIIGRSLRGPTMRPVQIQSFSDFIEVFGEPVPGGKGGDVWRDGNRTAPTYGAYAAQAYLRNSNPVTFIRLAGYQNPEQTSGYQAGWSKQNAYGLFVAPIVSSSADVYTMNATASLAAVLYSDETSFGLIGKELSGSTMVNTGKKATWIRANGTNLEFKIVTAGVTSSVNFDENSKKYIRNVLNTNPIMTNGSIVEDSEKERYFLGETFKTWVEDNNGGSIGSADFAGILLPLSTGSVNFANHKYEAIDGETGWIVSQHLEESSSFAPNATGEYPVTKLFKLVSLTEGDWNSKNLKISVEDIKEPPSQYVKFGTFTVSIRKIDDTDLNPQYVERFSGLTLDPSSENFISKKIGDKYSEWDYTKKAFVEYGVYNNQSKFIRVEMNPDVENGLTDPGLLPYGFYGPKVYTMNVVNFGSGSNVLSSGFVGTQITSASPFTASFALPQMPLLETSTESSVPTLSSVYWGLKTNVGSTKKANKDLVDYVRSQAKLYNASTYQFLFTLDDVSGSLTGSDSLGWTIENSKTGSWAIGNRATGKSLTATGYTGSNGQSLLLTKFNKFTMPIVGGSDGLDITEKDAFNRRILSSGGEVDNYAFNSVKVAIESLADPEVVEMNLATIPGVENEALTSLLIDKCEQRGDALAIIDLKGDYVPDEGKDNPSVLASSRKPNVDMTVLNMKNRAINSSYGCAYFPWVLVRDTLNNNTVWVPPSIAALGTFSSSQRKTELWFAPAGFNRGGLSDGAAGLPVIQTSLRLSSKDRDTLYDSNINPIATFPAEGVVIFGQKTLQVTPSALDRVNVRRLMIYLKKEISRMATTVLFDPNINVTWKRFTDMADPFLASVQSRFGLSEYRVVLDETTTTPDLVDRNIVYAKILLKPTRAIEFIAIDFVITNTGASFND
jgi:hypothetical protein